jgi:hypothetical protein
MIAEGDEATDSLYISNAAYLSSWENHRKVDIPTRGSAYELEFEKAFESELKKRK